MNGSLERVRRVMAGDTPDRAPLFDLLPNDAVLRHFNGGVPVDCGDDRGGIRALVAATDATRFSSFSPQAARRELLPDGREIRYERWTTWTPPRAFASSDAYAAEKSRQLAAMRAQLDDPFTTADDAGYRRHRALADAFGADYCLLLYAPSPALMAIYEEVGLEAFSYYLYDCEAAIVDQLEWNTEYACRWAAGLPADDPFEMVFIGEDIACKSGPLVSPAWLAREYVPRLQRVIAALHARGKRAMFHSDGNLYAILDGLVAAGIDALNPIEVAAGMELAEVHRRYPRLVCAGGIDVSHLLPFGTPGQVRDAVTKAIDDTEGRLLVGSSTEVFDIVPLENYLALREAAMAYRFS